MKVISRISPSAFEAEFLSAEWYKGEYDQVRAQFDHIVRDPDIHDEQQNIIRRSLLWEIRRLLLQNLPINIEWHQVEIALSEFGDLLAIRERGWVLTLGPGKNLTEISKAIRNGVTDKGIDLEHVKGIKDSIGTHSFSERIVLISSSLSGPYTILDGNHRAVAFKLFEDETGSSLHIPSKYILGVSPDMHQSPWLNL